MIKVNRVEQRRCRESFQLLLLLFLLHVTDLMVLVLSDFCRSSYEGYDGEEAEPPKRKEGDSVKEERYSPWAADRDHRVRTESPAGADPRDLYNAEQLVPAAASYQPYR